MAKRKTIRTPALCRNETNDVEVDDDALQFSVSSEYPVERAFGREVLSHDPEAVDLSRVEQGAVPLLFNHQSDAVIGMVDAAELRDGKVYIDAHLFDTERAREVRKMLDGGLRNVSMQYRLDQIEEDEDEQGPIYRATRWGLLEASVVSMPADPTVGIGRSQEKEFETRVITRDSGKGERVVRTPGNGASAPHNNNKRVNPMPDKKETVIEDGDNSAAELESSRVRAIKNLASANNISEDVQARWITSGASVEKVSNDLMSILKTRSENAKPVSEIGLTDAETRRFSLGRAIRAAAEGNWSEAGFEAEVSGEVAKRTGKVADGRRIFVPNEVQQRGFAKRGLVTNVPSAGGYLVQTNDGGMSFIDILRNKSVVYRAGAFRLPGLVGNVAIPKQLTAATAYWVGEKGSVTLSQQSFDQITMTPKTAGALTEVSRQLLLQSAQAVDALVMNDLSQQIALAVDKAAIDGTGLSGQPLGVINTPDVGSVSATSITYANLVEFQTDCAAANALSPNSAYVTTPTVAGILKAKVKYSGTASPFWEGKLDEAVMDGYAAFASNQMPSGGMLFGDFSQLVIGEWGVLELEVDPHYGFATGQVGVRALYSVDTAVRHAKAFSYSSSVTA